MLKNRLVPLSGIVFVALILASVFTINPPGSNARASTVLTYYQVHHNATSASALLTGLGVIFGVLFFGYLREYLRQDRATRWLASTAFGGVLLFAAGGAISAGALWTLTVLVLATSSVPSLVAQRDVQVACAAVLCASAVVLLARRNRCEIGWMR